MLHSAHKRRLIGGLWSIAEEDTVLIYGCTLMSVRVLHVLIYGCTVYEREGPARTHLWMYPYEREGPARTHSSLLRRGVRPGPIKQMGKGRGGCERR